MVANEKVVMMMMMMLVMMMMMMRLMMMLVMMIVPDRLGEGPALAPRRVEYPESLCESWEPPLKRGEEG